MIQKYVWIIHPQLFALSTVLLLTSISHLQSRHTHPPCSALTKQITTIKTYLYSTFPQVITIMDGCGESLKVSSLRAFQLFIVHSLPTWQTPWLHRPSQHSLEASSIMQSQEQKKANRKRAEQPGAKLVTRGWQRNTGRWIVNGHSCYLYRAVTSSCCVLPMGMQLSHTTFLFVSAGGKLSTDMSIQGTTRFFMHFASKYIWR